MKRKPREGVCGGLQSQLSSAPARSDFPERGESLLSHLGHVSDPVLLSISSLLTGWVVSGRSRSLLFICPSGVVTRHFRGSNVCVTLLPRPQHVPPKQRQKEPPPGRPFRHSDRCTEDAVFGRRGNYIIVSHVDALLEAPGHSVAYFGRLRLYWLLSALLTTSGFADPSGPPRPDTPLALTLRNGCRLLLPLTSTPRPKPPHKTERGALETAFERSNPIKDQGVQPAARGRLR